MARGAKRKKDFDREKDKTRNIEVELYPDTTSYNFDEVLEQLKTYFDNKWAYIRHDHDLKEDGSPKKSHVHFYGARKTAVKLQTVSNNFGVPANHVIQINDWDAAMKYAIHLNDTDKYLYSADSVIANFDYKKHVKTVHDDASDAMIIFRFIMDQNVMTKSKLVEWVLDNGYWGAYRRAQATWSDLLWENRQRMYVQYNVNEDLNTEAVQAANRVIFSSIDDNVPVPFEQLCL